MWTPLTELCSVYPISQGHGHHLFSLQTAHGQPGLGHPSWKVSHPSMKSTAPSLPPKKEMRPVHTPCSSLHLFFSSDAHFFSNEKKADANQRSQQPSPWVVHVRQHQGECLCCAHPRGWSKEDTRRRDGWTCSPPPPPISLLSMRKIQ